MNLRPSTARINMEIDNIRREKTRAKKRNSKEIKEVKSVLKDLFLRERINAIIIEEDIPISMYMSEIIGGTISMDVFTNPSFIVVTKNKIDCYLALGCVHSTWRSTQDSVRDYISNPKMNGYRSLDMQVFGPRSKRINFKFRTEEMHSNNVILDFSITEKQSYYDEMMAKIRLLEEQLADFPSKKIGIGHNHPPENSEFQPLSIENIDLIRDSVDEIKLNINFPKEKENILQGNAEELEKHGNIILNYISNKLELFATEATKEAGKETGKWVVRIGFWPAFAKLLLDAGQAVLNWLHASNMF